MKAVLTVIGKDKVGIIAEVSGILAEYGVNIQDISQTIMDDVFTMIMIVDMLEANVSFNQVSERLNDLGEKMGVSIRIQHQDIFEAMHKI